MSHKLPEGPLVPTFFKTTFEGVVDAAADLALEITERIANLFSQQPTAPQEEEGPVRNGVVEPLESRVTKILEPHLREAVEG